MADVTLPQLGETVTEGTITQWFKQVGDTVAADEPLFEVSTDKVDTEVPSPIAGVVTEIRVPEGETVDVGTVIAVIGDQGAAPADAAPAAPAPEAAPAPPPPAADAAPSTEDAPAAEAALDAGGPARSRRRAGCRGGTARRRQRAARACATKPGALPGTSAGTGRRGGEPRTERRTVVVAGRRRLVNEHGIDPGKIEGTGPGGRITARGRARLHRRQREPGRGARACHGASAPPAPAARVESARG